MVRKTVVKAATAGTITRSVKKHLADKDIAFGTVTTTLQFSNDRESMVWCTTVQFLYGSEQATQAQVATEALADYRLAQAKLDTQYAPSFIAISQPENVNELLAAAQDEADRAKAAERREEQAKAMHEALDEAVASLDSEERWEEFLTVVANFGAKYSATNQLLIWIECAKRGIEPKFVQAYNAWRDAGHPVRKGEKGIAIWAPVRRYLSKEQADEAEEKYGKKIARRADGRSLNKELVGFTHTYVWDVSQVTEPEGFAIPEPTTITRRVKVHGPSPELLTGDDTTGRLDDVITAIEKLGLKFNFVPFSSLGGANGNTNGKTVNVRDDVDPAQQVKTAVHEWAHNLLGHVNPDFDYVAHRGRAETEAESVAFVVLGALGLDTGKYSAPYVRSWSEGKPELIKETAERVIKTAKQILLTLDAMASKTTGSEVPSDGAELALPVAS